MIVLMKINITVEPLFKNYKKQYIYSWIEDSEVVEFLNVIMQVWRNFTCCILLCVILVVYFYPSTQQFR
jgi:hypothetical protein